MTLPSVIVPPRFRTRYLLNAFVLFFCAGFVRAQNAANPIASQWSWPDAETRTALSYIRLLPPDLHLRTDYVPRDACRLLGVDAAMADPASMPNRLEDVAHQMFLFDPMNPHIGNRLSLSQLIRPLLDSEGWYSPTTDSQSMDMENMPLPDGSSIMIDSLWQHLLAYALIESNDTNWIDSVCPSLHGADRSVVYELLPELILEDAADKDKLPEELDDLQKSEDSLAAHFATLADSVHWRWVWQRGLSVLDRLIQSLPSYPPADTKQTMFADSVVRIRTKQGVVVFGSRNDDLFEGDPLIVIDPGGDDVYKLDACRMGHLRMIVDWDGDDAYFAPDGHDLGAGIWNWGLLIDRNGNDTYRAGSFSLGAGWFGVGALLDLAGHDIYTGDTYTQGAGGFGIGILFDAGDESDTYIGRLFAQGFGFSAGIGVLADRGGNDSYVAGGLYEDVLRYRDHYISLSQGFGYGIRPHFSGGIGLLLDRRGNDVYNADIFGQGCSYWWGFGGLYDGSGNDQYVAFQYAQGSATHLTAGCLFDRAGDDVYFAKGVSQGCGHDWAAGLLIDAGGNDRYTATDLSQAAGSANGVGILIDDSGDDSYCVESDLNTHGYGNPRREYGSIGLFLDLCGSDRYVGPGSDAKVWLGGSKWGVGVDADSTWRAHCGEEQ